MKKSIKAHDASFWNWAGNSMEWKSYYSYIALAIILIGTLLVYLFRKRIKKWFVRKENEKVMGVKNINVLLQIIGVVGLIYTFIRIAIYQINDYPLKWEYLHIHLCRLHFVVMMFLFIFKKKEWILYLTYMSWIGAVVGVTGGTLNYDSKVIGGSETMEIFEKAGIGRYNVGPDNYFFYDMILFHITVALLPSVIFAGTYRKITAVNLYRMIIGYVLASVLIWTTNIATSQINNIQWRSNNWYLGFDKYNSSSDTIGWLTAWPQNVFGMSLIGAFSINAAYLVTMLFRRNFKKEFNELVESHDKTLLKRILWIRLEGKKKSTKSKSEKKPVKTKSKKKTKVKSKKVSKVKPNKKTRKANKAKLIKAKKAKLAKIKKENKANKVKLANAKKAKKAKIANAKIANKVKLANAKKAKKAKIANAKIANKVKLANAKKAKKAKIKAKKELIIANKAKAIEVMRAESKDNKDFRKKLKAAKDSVKKAKKAKVLRAKNAKLKIKSDKEDIQIKIKEDKLKQKIVERQVSKKAKEAKLKTKVSKKAKVTRAKKAKAKLKADERSKLARLKANKKERETKLKEKAIKEKIAKITAHEKEVAAIKDKKKSKSKAKKNKKAKERKAKKQAKESKKENFNKQIEN